MAFVLTIDSLFTWITLLNFILLTPNSPIGPLCMQFNDALSKSFRPSDEYDSDSDDDFSDDEELQSPIDDVDPFILFVDAVKAMQASDPLRVHSLMQTPDFQYQALANGVAQHAEQRRAEIEKEKMEKAAAATAS
ncbi:hypothetical protein TB2_031293 [Malus domestica]